MMEGGGGGDYRASRCSDCLNTVFSFQYDGDNWQIIGGGWAKFCMEIERNCCSTLFVNYS